MSETENQRWVGYERLDHRDGIARIARWDVGDRFVKIESWFINDEWADEIETEPEHGLVSQLVIVI